ncbi:competence protein CoiA family protein [Belliella pelovolcani]|uniref:Competence protein CoiA-like family protein n=1 Tax=Belliella pelovolcani TaxID=529505 RepID=A0A1N7Q4E5_9BACT|nr:competence protein CoiA family protein [Belliella pelovolcani]SIT17477.1 Competence protein CoiA-like family protein [Belliella pelovolcani]
MHKLEFGLKNNELVTIDDVEGGLACDCICPNCNKQLIARKGELKEHHFAHYKSDDCNYGTETAIHLLAKEVIAKASHFTTPQLLLNDKYYEIFDEISIPIDQVWVEKHQKHFIPDIIIESGGKKLYIEIIVTNNVSWQKMQLIRDRNLPFIAFNALRIKNYLRRNFKDLGNDENFIKELVEGTRHKYWLHNPKREKIREILSENYAEVKPIKSFGNYNFEYVADCLLEKNEWKSKKLQGQFYAKPEKDCEKCRFFLGQNRIDSRENVHCIAYMQFELNALVKKLSKNI